MLHWYYKLVALHPKWVAIIVMIVSLACIFLSVTMKKLPDFTDPALGFEARGTPIANRLTAWENLLEETRPSGRLTANPYSAVYKASPLNNKRIHKKNGMRKRKPDASKGNSSSNAINSAPISTNEIGDRSNRSQRDTADVVSNSTEIKSTMKGKRRKKAKSPTVAADQYFCDAPSREYAHFVLEQTRGTDTNASLFEFDAVYAMCDMEIKLTNLKGFDHICQVKMASKTCCRPWSIPNYFALLSNKSSCADIEKEDIPAVKQILSECYEFYRNGSLQNDCETIKCNVPTKCAQFNAVYQIFHFLADNKVNETNISTTKAMLFLPIAKSTKSLPYYYEISASFQPVGNISIVAIDMGLKNALFDELLIYDGWLIGLGAMFILYCILIYTNSIIITLSTVFANFFAISIAYFVYEFVFQLPYFPFMNLLAIIIIVGIGADDCFVFVKEWRLALTEWNAKKEHSSKRKSTKMIYLMENSMNHAAKSIFVTSLTTTFAFFASYFSSITAVRCFGLYAGTVVSINYILMITWLPAIVAIVESSNFRMCFCWQTYVESINDSIDRFGDTMQRAIIYLVNKFKYLFIILFLAIGIASCVIVLYYPKLGLPDSQDFQLFCKDHPFELYDSKYKGDFRFEKSFTEAETFKFPIRFVWGAKDIDDGNYLIPSSKGHLHIQPNFTISSQESQQWLLHFCKELRKQDFYQPINVPAILPNCFIENLIENMNKRCSDPMTQVSRAPCCDEHTFPYPPDVFNQCLPEMISSLYKSPRYIFVPGTSGPKFERNSTQDNSTTSPIIRALVIEYESSQPFSTSFTEITNFTSHVQNWFDDILKSAPIALRDGWFISELNFYDLQQTLSSGTIIAASIAMSTSLVVLLLVTMNVLISIYAVLTVVFTILTTIAILVLLNWKLNILESIAVSTAIGLGIDFVFHYALNYRLSDKPDRRSCTNFTLSRMIGPTLMAAITTWLAGFFMMFSSLLAYIQIGMFLMIVMMVSWLYATFFFASLLSAMGPKMNTGDDQLNHLQDVELIQKENGRNLEIHESNRIADHAQD